MTDVNQNWGQQPQKDQIKWNPLLVNSDGINVKWSEKYGQKFDTDCIGLWENTNQYMLTWKDSRKIVLEKSNIINIEYIKK